MSHPSADRMPVTGPLSSVRVHRVYEKGESEMGQVVEEKLKTPVAGEYDLIVAGAGPAGVAAAIAAARAAADTLLIEANGCLGGTWTAGILAYVFDMQSGIGMEIIERLKERRAYVQTAQEGEMREGRINFTYDIESMKLILDRMCREAGVDVLLHTRVVAAAVDDERRLRTIVTESKSGRQAWRAHAFVDATGDGDLGALAGNGFDMGSEEDGALQPMTYMGLIVVRSAEEVADCISFWQGVNEHGPRLRSFLKHLHALDIEPSYGGATLFQVRDNLLAIMINHEYGKDATDTRDVTEATFSGRAEVNRIVDALSATPGPFEGCLLAATPEYIGVREGRRLHGRYRVTADDLLSGARFRDAVARVRFGVDIHSPDPEKGTGNTNLGMRARPYDIPMRALIARDVDGLLMAGRCISGDWIAFSSYRVTGEAVSMGQTAGALSAVSAQTGRLPHEVPWTDVEPAIPHSAGSDQT